AVPLGAAGLEAGPDCWADGAASDGLAAEESAAFPGAAGAAGEQAESAPTAARAAPAVSAPKNRRRVIGTFGIGSMSPVSPIAQRLFVPVLRQAQDERVVCCP